MGKVGIIAGYGDLARDVINECKSRGEDYYILAYENQTDSDLVSGHPHDWVTLGKVSKALKLLRDNDVDQIVMAGYFNRPSWNEIKPDLKGAVLLSKLAGKPMGDDGLFRGIVDFFEGEGFKVISPDDFIGKESFVPEGCLTKVKPDEQAKVDIKRGMKVAKGLGKLDVGQGVVVQRGLVLAVEAIEGTDEMIKRSATLAKQGSGGILVKVIKPEQDIRVDRSVIGDNTVRVAAQAGLRGIAVEADSVILLNKDETIALANKRGIFIVGVKDE